ncbi:MAG TPA: DUF3488 domain-containing protein [Myxococcales bacterium]|nr:DUF3488 domain-containing protein [Myxococcales bacterium]HIK86106.1 DUF3488 domain-containing protein [Myxococcales bacterium]
MSRHEFRSRVAGPRPAAAWLMSLVASGALWLTDQIPVWMIGLQSITFLVSYLVRHHPPALFKSALWLNVLMAGITTITIRSALDGNPAAISLAYFTALSQGLQLLDARPRKSEFVLVALGLFQVILASNLTDSVFFSPLVLIFLMTVTWTLLVHTLSMEAAEAGDPAAVSTILAPDLRRMTIRATTLCLLLAVVIFVLFPRLKTNMLRGGSRPGMALSGFSDRLTLGDIGKIRMDHSVVLRVEGLEGRLPAPGRAYWRGLAFDEFDGKTWSISTSERVAKRRRLSGVGRFGIELRPERSRRPGDSAGAAPLIVQRIIREPVKAGVLFVPGQVQKIVGSFQHLERDRNGGLYLPGRGDERVRYTIWTEGEARDPEALRRDRSQPPFEMHPGGSRLADRYRRLPHLDDRIRLLTESLVAGADNDFDRAVQIQESLRLNGRYTDAPPLLGDRETTPVEAFILGELEGHCEFFASAMVAMARTQGLSSRLVNGFAGGVVNEVGGFIEVTQADAHAWVEVHFEQAGWVRFDPTPPDRRLRAAQAQSWWTRVGQLGGALELWWFQRVVDFDSVDQIGALRGLWLRWQTNKTSSDVALHNTSTNSGAPSYDLFIDENTKPVLGVILLVGLVSALWIRVRRTGDGDMPKPYRDALALLGRRGIKRSKSDSARGFAEAVSQKISAAGGRAFQIITESYLAERFGSKPSAPLASQLSILKNAVDGMRLGNQAHIR